jgi:predicted nucleic acid-binding protein
MILTDAGPLIAILDGRDPSHARCRAALERLDRPLVTTWPALAEAMHFLGFRAGWRGQEKLWRLLLRGDLVVKETSGSECGRAAALMRQYRDLPMDLADATLVALAETLGQTRILTLDHHFRVYRLRGRARFDLVLDGE